MIQARHMRRASAVALFLGGLALALPAGAATQGAAAGFPRLGLYGSMHGNGSPFYNVPTDSTLSTSVLDAVSRYDAVILDVSPITPYRPSVIDELHARNPDLKAFAYMTIGYIWPVADPDSLNHLPTRIRRLVRDLGGFLYNSVDGQEFDQCNVNLAKRDGTGRFIVAESLADFYESAILTNRPWDGMFLDVFCTSMLWMQDPIHQVDYVRAGYPTLAAFDAAWGAATDTLARRLRRELTPGKLLVGNCVASAHHDALNGMMRENFPSQGGGSWSTNILQDPKGYLSDDRDYIAPPQNWLSSWVVGGAASPYSTVNTYRVRYGLASAALGEGYGVFGTTDRNSDTAPYHLWWYDEYAVDGVTGRSTTDLAHTHWLGVPLGPGYQMIWAGTNPDACTNPGFETSTAGWTLGQFAPAAGTFTRDTTTAGEGRASAHVHVSSVGTASWNVNLTTTTTLPLTAGLTYTATFWARASAPRVLPVTASFLSGGGLAEWDLTLGTTWKHYQVTLLPSGSGSTALEFFLGAQTGDVWLDDVHFQQGVTNIWRRDFQNGVVLVNPSTFPMQVPLGSTYRRILGTAAPLVNDGSSVTTANVPATDALFLLGSITDTTPPASVRDLGPGH